MIADLAPVLEDDARVAVPHLFDPSADRPRVRGRHADGFAEEQTSTRHPGQEIPLAPEDVGLRGGRIEEVGEGHQCATVFTSAPFVSVVLGWPSDFGVSSFAATALAAPACSYFRSRGFTRLMSTSSVACTGWPAQT